MECMVWTGKPLKVTVNPGGAPGQWSNNHVHREVYAVGYQGGATLVLVVDDAGKLTWLSPANYTLERRGRPRLGD